MFKQLRKDLLRNIFIPKLVSKVFRVNFYTWWIFRNFAMQDANLLKLFLQSI